MSSLLAHPVVQNIIQSFLSNLEFYTPKILMAIAILGFGSLVAIGVYRLVRYGFKKLKIDEFIARLETDTKEEKKSSKKHILKISKKIPLDEVVAKAMAYYIFLVFFRFSIVAI